MSLIKKHRRILWHIPLCCLVITKLSWAGEAVHTVGQVLVCKYKDLSSIPQKSYKIVGVVVCIYDPRSWESREDPLKVTDQLA